MNLGVWARVLPALLIMPLGPLPARVIAGATIATALSAWLPNTPIDTVSLAAELALGCLIGILTAIPVWAATAIRGESGPPSLGFAGQVIAWATFFGMGGAALWIAGFAQTFTALPAAAWPTANDVIAQSSTLFYGVLCCGLPAWLVALWVAPTAAWIDRVGRTGLGLQTAVAVRPVLTLALTAAMLPLILDVIREMFTVALGG